MSIASMSSERIPQAKGGSERGESAPAATDVWSSLEQVCVAQGLGALATRLAELRPWLEGDLADVERALADVAAAGETVAEQSARHLLATRGKRLRPLCVALAARTGSGFGEGARQLAVSVELVHAATLLHDDVVDSGDLRRGLPTARVVYGNAASIFGGDWLLCEALCRIQASQVADVLPRMLGVIKEMVIAEALQLAAKGRVDARREEYLRIARGKTASLFSWAGYAGGRAGESSPEACEALASYGDKLGLAFQIVDDVLDVAGDPGDTGKSLLADVREGKMTYPLILAAEEDPALARSVAALVTDGGEIDATLLSQVARALLRSGAVEASLETAVQLSREAAACLEALPPSPARAALEAVALSTVRRRR
jgi:octaprenyl-diphosphate synthase